MEKKDSLKLTLSMPCFGRPKRTVRAIECIANQNINGWEALVVGDGCPVMQDFISSCFFLDLQRECKAKGNDLIIKNNQINYGGSGYAITNQNILIAKGKYFMFFANDDVILPNHFENYLSSIDGTNYDFVYFNSLLPMGKVRVSSLNYGCIGHSELIVRTDFLKQMPPHSEHYGHDWELILEMIKRGKSFHSKNSNLTYNVMSLPNNREQGID